MASDADQRRHRGNGHRCGDREGRAATPLAGAHGFRGHRGGMPARRRAQPLFVGRRSFELAQRGSQLDELGTQTNQAVT